MPQAQEFYLHKSGNRTDWLRSLRVCNSWSEASKKHSSALFSLQKEVPRLRHSNKLGYSSLFQSGAIRCFFATALAVLNARSTELLLSICRGRLEKVRYVVLTNYSWLVGQKHSKYCFLKNPENLTDNQRTKLDDVVQYDLKSVRVYLLKESFQLLWTYTSAYWAGWYLEKWCKRAMRSKLEPRKSYGFCSFENLKIALFHTMGDLPEPDPTHEFFWRGEKKNFTTEFTEAQRN